MPSAPARIASLTMSHILLISSWVASLSWLSGPITKSLMAECPISAPTLMPNLGRIWSRYSGKLCQENGTASSKVVFFMSSITPNILTILSASSLPFMGARLSEQLPVTTVVMPCSIEGVACPSQHNCGSKCVWISMKPGETTKSLASIVSRASPSS